jgi:hypothetical protein
MQQDPLKVVSVPNVDISNGLERFLDYILSHNVQFFHFLQSIIGLVIAISIPICLLLLIGIIISAERLRMIRKKEHILYHSPPVDMGYDEVTKSDNALAERWDKVNGYVESENPNDWRHAIIEADIMLEDLLTKLGYKGEGIGEKLQRVEKGDFKTLDQAWEAHKVRNRIAHDGTNFDLSQHEARRVIKLYREVFEEFFYI